MLPTQGCIDFHNMLTPAIVVGGWFLFAVVMRPLPRKRKLIPQTPLEQVRSALTVPSEIALVPLKYEKYGTVLVVPPPSPSGVASYPPSLGAALCRVLKVKVVVAQSRSGGELRTPTMSRVLYAEGEGGSTVATHVENGTTYSFDVMRIMWSSGNVKERSRYGREVTAPGETVLDMFAGIGYFSLPLASAPPKPSDRPLLLVGIEKNVDSFEFLSVNFARVAAAGHCCPNVLLHGDNRDLGEEYVGRCDRILMGYLPDTEKFLPRALQFASRKGCLIHFHFLQGTKENGVEVAAAHFSKFVTASNITAVVNDVRKIKSYAPNITHSVADVMLTFKG